jgi:hypothetical protein
MGFIAQLIATLRAEVKYRIRKKNVDFLRERPRKSGGLHNRWCATEGSS